MQVILNMQTCTEKGALQVNAGNMDVLVGTKEDIFSGYGY